MLHEASPPMLVRWPRAAHSRGVHKRHGLRDRNLKERLITQHTVLGPTRKGVSENQGQGERPAGMDAPGGAQVAASNRLSPIDRTLSKWAAIGRRNCQRRP